MRLEPRRGYKKRYLYRKKDDKTIYEEIRNE